MIRVTHVITDTNIGGAGRILLNLLRSRDRERFEMSVILPRGSQLAPEIKALSCELAEADFIADKSFSAAAVFELSRILRGRRPDVVHTHAAMSARIAARLFVGCKVVNTRHSVFDVAAYKKRFPYRHLSGFVNNYFSDRIIAVSPAAKDNVTDMGADPDRVAVIFNGVDPVRTLTAEEKVNIRARYGFSDTDFVCAIIARLEKVKGHEYIIAAAKGLPPGVKVLIAGTGGELESLRRAASGLNNCVFAGFVKDIYEIENIMDAQLNASYGTEATSAALLEGMSLGVPAIVSDFGGNPYVIENGVNGLVVPKRDPAAICAAIAELRADSERYKIMSGNCKEIFGRRFTSRAMAEATENEYIKLLDG